MKILAVSDNHGDRQILQTIFAAYGDQVDAIFHCGDSEMTRDDPLFKGVQVVKGNNDFGTDFPNELQRVIGGTKIFMTHGHLYDVGMSLTRLDLKAREIGALVVLFGHTHQLAAETSQGRLYVNPGSISLPRGEFASIGGTFAIIDVQPAQMTVDFYDRQLQKVDQLHQQFQR
ncbi:metallophosphoesterase [Secundilactobacillus pentosiphilus]|uniref:Phosphoesterase n=1 Tax=Secundilactobacillus pentosiphilus TaxID=1714682 RepID=A0A1Z5IPS2_9LACO|nr:metallophosphoesterase [Secundilactobacillus pentosiphilus]GAX03745.1 metallophosphoesterase [Secundilactobacillus pentosiphilus]GAX05237.1 metallophosphoesterase [Secundilactobacillus pentosiphilus]